MNKQMIHCQNQQRISLPGKYSLIKMFSVLIVLTLAASCTKKAEKILVFSKTVEFRHESIEKGITALNKMGAENNFQVTSTEDAQYFNEDSLAQYAAVVFLNTTGNVLDDVQQADFERYIQAGGGFVGIHSATDTEYDWPWYTKLVGAQFNGHPKIQEAKLNIIDQKHAATKSMDSVWMKIDEYYNFKNLNPKIDVLVTVDESSYEGGTNGANHPISWSHTYDGGRAFYTALGHTEESFENPVFLNHLLGGIKYTVGDNRRDFGKAVSESVPPENRFVKNILDFNLNEPMELDELSGEGILFIERRGALKLFNFETKKTDTIALLDVFYGNEDGLLGLAVDPNYKTNHWIYLFYSAPTGESRQHVSRFNLADKKLDKNSEKILLVIPTERHCCHSGGSIEFGPGGNLFIAVGDNTNPFESAGFAPIDERAGRKAWDAQKSAANTNDFRGKILRIKPEDNGTYSIPEGNLYPIGTPLTKPEIYVMGCRNPFRPSIDSKTGFVYWGDVGPDAGEADPNRGPSGMGEFDQARKAGFWGWPYTRGYNEPYNDFDFATQVSGPKFDPNHLINNSPNNTGLNKLPPAQPSMIPMTYYRSEEFPWMGKGGINPMAGPVFHASDHPNAANKFPKYFENKLFVYEWMRDWIYVITLDKDHNYVKADAFMPGTQFSKPMDMIFGSDGNLYVLEYGQSWNTQNLDARLSSISYLAGNRNPIAKIENDKVIGSAPLTIHFSGAKSLDYDNDKLTYEWSFDKNSIQSTEKNLDFTFRQEGIYDVTLKVTDTEGHSSTANTRILVGNDIPELSIEVTPNDSMYQDYQKLSYKVKVNDKQDGSTDNGTITARDVIVTFDYLPEGKDKVTATIGHQRAPFSEGQTIIELANCKACHAIDVHVNGPRYIDIANKYTNKDKGYLVSKIIKGGGGVWGERAMPAHPQLSVEEVSEILDYVLSLKEVKKSARKELPLAGSILFDQHIGKSGKGSYILMASYRDKGIRSQPNSEVVVTKEILFSPKK